tara:strand:- start:527 stop:1024 length:498 start_codon:yes stop_codon:yes gene_type:complete
MAAAADVEEEVAVVSSDFGPAAESGGFARQVSVGVAEVRDLDVQDQAKATRLRLEWPVAILLEAAVWEAGLVEQARSAAAVAVALTARVALLRRRLAARPGNRTVLTSTRSQSTTSPNVSARSQDPRRMVHSHPSTVPIAPDRGGTLYRRRSRAARVARSYPARA